MALTDRARVIRAAKAIEEYAGIAAYGMYLTIPIPTALIRELVEAIREVDTK